MVVPLTIWLSITLKEVSRTNLFLAVRAHKMLWVPCAAHGGYYLWKQHFTLIQLFVQHTLLITGDDLFSHC